MEVNEFEINGTPPELKVLANEATTCYRLNRKLNISLHTINLNRGG